MKKIIAILITIALIIAAVTLVKKRKQEVADAKTANEVLTTIKVYKPTIKELSQSESFLATLKAQTEPQISSKLSSFVKKIYVKEADVVKKGEVLVEIDDADIVLFIESLNASRVAIKQDLKLSYKNLKRAKALYDIGGISKESYEMAGLGVENKKARLTEVDKNIKAKKELLKYSKILSPIDGVVGDIFIKEGSLTAPAKPILNIIGDTKQLTFSYASSSPIKVGQKVIVFGFEEEISSIYQSSKNSLITAQITLQNDLKLPSGSSVDIKVIYQSKKGTAVPLNAFLHDDGTAVMIFKDGEFFKQKVTIEVADDEFAIISAEINQPVAIGSESKLSRLQALKNVKVIFDEK